MRKYLSRFLCLVILLGQAACSYESVYKNTVPENVQKMDDVHIQAILEKNREPFLYLQGDMTDEEFDAAFERIFAAVYDGDVLDRGIAATETVSNVTSSGSSQAIQTIFEIKKGDGYTIIQLTYASDETGACCDLTSLNVSGHDVSPYNVTRKTITPLAIAVMIVTFLGICGIIYLYRSLLQERRNAAGNRKASNKKSRLKRAAFKF